MLNRFAMLARGLWVCIKAPPHCIKQGLMFIVESAARAVWCTAN
jgi:hypothetical protein